MSSRDDSARAGPPLAVSLACIDDHASQFACLDPIRPERCRERPGLSACAAQVVLNQMDVASQRVVQSMTLADLIVPQLEASNQ